MESFETLSPPVRAAMERSLTSGRAALTRRSLVGACGAALGLGAISACGIPAATSTNSGSTEDRSDKEKVLHFSNWPLYIDVDDKDENLRPSLRAFSKQTGIKVDYTEDISDNDAFFGKIKPQLAAGQDTGRDLMVLTDWMASRLIRLGWVQKLDPANMPHAFTNLDQRFRNPAWDPGRAYSYPWAGIQTVIAYNEKATKGKKITSISQMLSESSLKGRVTMLTEMRDTVGLTLLDMGVDPAKVTEDQYDAAIARIQKSVDSKHIRKFTGNEYGQELASGDIAACVAWGGDLIQLQADSPHIKYVVPDAGYMTSTDNLLVPAKAKHKKNAERLIDHYYRPDVAAELAAYVNYVSPVRGAREELLKLDKEAANNPLILPDAAMAAKAHEFRALTAEEEKRFEQKFSKLIGA
ncbi:polyamine ABC transporter substrate-binding protein [Wenjunlia tyrosinilytica]|uniref:ABC transporter substrate-binding protein n=1 Tax=Wenjunlia tyrosinilytica TaxID=1544741 RepID=A0A917ZUG9_9ACTN|nr:spermidine/putrescine ABC transporter substrate-binding protein [Wenjunlia tyrosinilytica]GGO93635.1 ABC transporter substrate-binding protein [Wenjunlia tyrosinilytica]